MWLNKLCRETETDSISNITADKWTKVKTESQKWIGLDKYGSVWESTNWDEGDNSCMMAVTYFCVLKEDSNKQLNENKKPMLKESKQCQIWNKINPLCTMLAQVRHLKNGHDLLLVFSTQNIFACGACNRKIPNIQTVRIVSFTELRQSVDGKNSKDMPRF